MTAVLDVEPLRDAFYVLAAEAADEAVEAAADDARQFCSRRSGDLADSIGVGMPEDTATVLRRTLVATAEHASYQDEGTGIYGPHGTPITGLFFFDWPASGGEVRYTPDGRAYNTVARTITGSQPTRFFTRAVEGWEAHLADAVGARLG